MVIADQDARAALIREGIDATAAKVSAERGIAVNAVVPEKTFAEVVNLVEWPTVAAGSFDEEFLEVPREVLENAMESHQRYFPLEDAEETCCRCSSWRTTGTLRVPTRSSAATSASSAPGSPMPRSSTARTSATRSSPASPSSRASCSRSVWAR